MGIPADHLLQSKKGCLFRKEPALLPWVKDIMVRDMSYNNLQSDRELRQAVSAVWQFSAYSFKWCAKSKTNPDTVGNLSACHEMQPTTYWPLVRWIEILLPTTPLFFKNNSQQSYDVLCCFPSMKDAPPGFQFSCLCYLTLKNDTAAIRLFCVCVTLFILFCQW